MSHDREWESDDFSWPTRGHNWPFRCLDSSVLVQLPVSQRQNSTLRGFVLFSCTFVFQCFFSCWFDDLKRLIWTSIYATICIADGVTIDDFGADEDDVDGQKVGIKGWKIHLMPNAQSCQEVLLPESLIMMRVMEMMVSEVSIEWYCSCKRLGWCSLW